LLWRALILAVGIFGFIFLEPLSAPPEYNEYRKGRLNKRPQETKKAPKVAPRGFFYGPVKDQKTLESPSSPDSFRGMTMNYLNKLDDKGKHKNGLQDKENLAVGSRHSVTPEPYHFYWIRWWCQSRFSF